MLSYALRRLLGAIPTLLILLTLAFVMMRAAPGGPFDADRELPPQVRANLEAKYHLDEPLYQQYGRYIWDVAHFDFGPSFQYRDTSVNDLIAQGFPVSLKLGAASLAFALIFGIPLGMLAALRQNKPADYGAMTVAMLGISIPNFVLAPLMILLFAVYNDWLPAGGLGSWQNYVMPVLALGTAMMAYVARLARGSTIEVMRSNYVRTARAKGLSAARVVWVHALPAALTPIVSFLGPAAAGIITGSVVIETIFGIPGLGQFFVQGALNRDYTLVMGVVLFYGILIVLFNLAVDLLYGWLDPRVSY
ncbi:Binding-protein-dependent transport systems inner membrane component [Salinisphaera shabanensis E1L3A]|jgi:oligopeptide transport system permease protein|uniref:Binding-protein-dependent transport systems inner membrane component n=1 Tax=Salinisphaera shabanensis E1L3A TaxID=1033802 RepID=U2ER37_9GAMM|nr:oligopeptide ABC transporter permease OppB [Salinisphaera shabanensis]ERJ20497.1 Binding-protein-dependent transport systems inner membrane component [Salinisphaera shabanensis E1L3A]